MAGDVRTGNRLHSPAAVHPYVRSFVNAALPMRGARCLFLTLVLLVTTPLGLGAQTITVTVAGADPNAWNIGSFGLAQITAPAAGRDFTATQTGPNPTVTISTVGFPAGQTARVLISKAADATWNSTYTLLIRRRNGGNGGGTFTWSIPTTYTQVPTAPATLLLFSFQQLRNNVTVQLRLQNLTVAAGTTASTPSFLTTLIYTAVRP
jgi:hypothetical protein